MRTEKNMVCIAKTWFSGDGDVTNAGRTDGRTMKDGATQPMDAGGLI